MTARISGVATLMTINVATTLNVHMNQARKFCGIIVSIVSVSFEKRFKMRPSGVVS